MNAWWKTVNGDYFNPDHIDSLFAESFEGSWRLAASIGDQSFHLNGTWATAGEAREIARKLTHGFDPVTLDS